LASAGEEGAIRTYVFQGPDGYYIIKIRNFTSAHELERFESILQQNTQFAFKNPEEAAKVPEKTDEGTLCIRRSVSEGQKKVEPQGFNTAHFIYNGGKTTKSVVVGSAHAVSKGISRMGTFVQNNLLGKQEEMAINPSTKNRVAFVHKVSGMLPSAGGFFVRGLTSLGGWLTRKIEPKFEEKKHDAEVNEQLENKPCGSIGQAALHSVVTVWSGMVEALDIIREGITDTTTSLVTHKYGTDAEQVFRSGIGIVTNVGLPGSKIFHKK